MLYYRSVIIDAITDKVEPLLRKWIAAAMNGCFSDNWYDAYARAVMDHYSEKEKIERHIEQGISPADAMDFTALLFLLFPYRESDSGKVTEEDGAFSRVMMFYGAGEDLEYGLRRLRRIRNCAVHDSCDPSFKSDDPSLQAGLQEKKWLDEIEDIMHGISPSFQLNHYREVIQQLIREGSENRKEDAFDILIEETESIRQECRRIWRFEFMDAPLARPLTGAAPWAEAEDDLSLLSWPSQAAAEPVQAEETAEKEPMDIQPAEPEGKKRVGFIEKLNKWLVG